MDLFNFYPGFQKVYETNKHEVLLNNDFNFNSYDIVSSNGIVTDYSFFLKIIIHILRILQFMKIKMIMKFWNIFSKIRIST